MLADDDADATGAADDDNVAGLDELPPVPVSNRLSTPRRSRPCASGLRSYRFRIATAPIELPADQTWQQFLATFARTYYVSATLRVAGDWTFLRDRLGLPAAVDTLALDDTVRHQRTMPSSCASPISPPGRSRPTARCAQSLTSCRVRDRDAPLGRRSASRPLLASAAGSTAAPWC